jgi:hypothetical protein
MIIFSSVETEEYLAREKYNDKRSDLGLSFEQQERRKKQEKIHRSDGSESKKK